MTDHSPEVATIPANAQRVLVLQGGGALGSYQAGAYQSLCHAGFEPEWVAGISIGAVNAAIIAGNEGQTRVKRLKEFWEMVSAPVPWKPIGKSDHSRELFNSTSAALIATFGVPGFFTPRIPPAPLWPPGSPQAESYYDTAPLKKTLERLVDFDRINDLKTRLSVGAVSVTTGNFKYFDNFEFRKLGKKIGPEHIMASGALPPGFPSIVIEGEHYWDGGLVSNTPLQWVLDSRPRLDTLAFQIDLWSARGELPLNLGDAQVRQKEIQFSSRTRAATDQYKRAQKLRIAVANLLKDIPDELRDHPEVKMLAAEADEKVCNIVHLIYNAKSYEGIAKDYEFSRRTMEEHWTAGYEDVVRALSHPEVMQCPDKLEGVRTFDWAHYRQE